MDDEKQVIVSMTCGHCFGGGDVEKVSHGNTDHLFIAFGLQVPISAAKL